MTDASNELPLAYPVRIEVTVATLSDAERKQREYADRRQSWAAPWHGATGRTWPAATRSPGRQIHDPGQKRLGV